MHRKVRGVITTRFGCQERTAWYPEGSREALEAVDALVREQTNEFTLSWEDWDDDAILKPSRSDSQGLRQSSRT